MTERERTHGRITIIASLLAAAIAVGSLVWNLSDTSTRANQAYAFVEANQNLPTRIGYTEKQIEAMDTRVCVLERMATNVAVLNTNVVNLSAQLERLQGDGARSRNMRPHQ